jgi:predicted ATP-grasp superfamily ATP-dependent carboligase
MKSAVAMVTGVGGPAGHAVSGYFHQIGIPVMCADMNMIDGPFSAQLPPASDKEFSRALEDILDRAEIRLLVPTVTEELPKVAERRDAIRLKSCAVFLSASESVRIANDKWETVRALSAHGIAVPRSYCGISKELLIETVPFPMLSKPRRGRGARHIELHMQANDLPPVPSTERIFQEFLPGKEYDVNLFANPGGDPVAAVVLEKTALKCGLVGNALAVQRVIEPDVAELAEAAVCALGLEGPIDIDIRRGTDGLPRILEINARVGANVRAAEEVLIAMLTNWRSQL